MTTTKNRGPLQLHSGFGKFVLNSPKGYSLKLINAQAANKRKSQTFHLNPH